MICSTECYEIFVKPSHKRSIWYIESFSDLIMKYHLEVAGKRVDMQLRIPYFTFLIINGSDMLLEG